MRTNPHVRFTIERGSGNAQHVPLRTADRGCEAYGRDYMAHATVRPSFVKAHADQTAHLAATD